MGGKLAPSKIPVCVGLLECFTVTGTQQESTLTKNSASPCRITVLRPYSHPQGRWHAQNVTEKGPSNHSFVLGLLEKSTDVRILEGK